MAVLRWVIDRRRRTRATCVDEKLDDVTSVATSTQSYQGIVEFRLSRVGVARIRSR